MTRSQEKSAPTFRVQRQNGDWLTPANTWTPDKADAWTTSDETEAKRRAKDGRAFHVKAPAP